MIKPETTTVPLAALRTDGGTQARDSLHEPTVEDYTDLLKAGKKLAPINALRDEHGASWVWDGFHRIEAHRRGGKDRIAVIFEPGSQRDAILRATAANQEHGLRRTNADKRRAVTMLLKDEEWQAWSNVLIAEHVGVSDEFVRKLRGELIPAEPPTVGGSEPEKRVGRDGKTRTVPPKKAAATKVVPDRQADGTPDYEDESQEPAETLEEAAYDATVGAGEDEPTAPAPNAKREDGGDPKLEKYLDREGASAPSAEQLDGGKPTHRDAALTRLGRALDATTLAAIENGTIKTVAGELTELAAKSDAVIREAVSLMHTHSKPLKWALRVIEQPVDGQTRLVELMNRAATWSGPFVVAVGGYRVTVEKL